MSYEPKQTNKTPEVLSFALLFCGIVCLVFSGLEIVKGKSILQTVGLVFFCAFIFVLVRYKMTRVKYTVRLKTKSKGYGSEDDDDEETVKLGDDGSGSLPITAYPPKSLEFAIDKAQGKRAFVTEMLVSMTDIMSCRPLPEDKVGRKEFLAAAPKGNSYKYLRNMVGAKQWMMTVRTSGGNVKIFFEPNEKMGEYLAAVAAYNREETKKRLQEEE